MPTVPLRPMRARDAGEPHRASTPLELFFDLTFVVAVSPAAAGLAHQVEAGHPGRGVGFFALGFFAIWWGWLNFTWFASAYDTDDWLYRVVTLVQMAGALTVAAGIPRVFAGEDFTVVTAGYVLMRLALVCQWLRAARGDPGHRPTVLRYAAGITVVQVLWVARLALPHPLATVSFLLLVLAELAVPPVAERPATTSYHPGHVAERYGLFTIIVLGEGVLAAGNSVITALGRGGHDRALITLAVGGLALLAGMWWLYFTVESAGDLTSLRRSFVWGYGHYGIFAAAAAVSSGIEVQVAAVTGGSEAGGQAARLAVGLPAAAFVLLVRALVLRPRITPAGNRAALAGGLTVAVAGFLPLPPVAATAVVAGLVALLIGYLVAEPVARPHPEAAAATASP